MDQKELRREKRIQQKSKRLTKVLGKTFVARMLNNEIINTQTTNTEKQNLEKLYKLGIIDFKMKFVNLKSE